MKAHSGRFIIAKASQDWAALKVLARHFGWWKAIRLGLALNQKVRRGAPFEALSPATEPKEIESREQIAGAIILYQMLRETMEQGQVLAIVAEVVEAAAHVFLAETIGPLGAAQLDDLSDDERGRFVEERLDKVPNTLVQIEEVRRDEVRFQVTKCRFVSLCAAVGVPELMPLFCAVDAS